MAGAAGAPSSRRATLAQLGAEPADLLIIGGGIVGTGIARDAAMRGLKTVLVERHDLGSGTSSRSSRLIHGGLRYLEQGHLRLVFEAVSERAVLQRIAPHLVHPLRFIFPLHDGDRLPRWKLEAGLWAYDILARFRGGRHHSLGRKALLAAEPMLRDRGVLGGAEYMDAQCDDARLVVATARSAIHHGALVANYVGVRALTRSEAHINGAVLEDTLTGDSLTIRAKTVVNATGPWVDELRRLEDPLAARMVRRTKGVHIVVDRGRVGHQAAIAFLSPIDGRVMFALPWGELSYIGTTDTDTTESPDDVRADADSIRYLLRSVNARFPSARLTEDDVRGTWAGLRPLLVADGPASDASREHAVVTGAGGMITVAGGKLTTYRVMAAEVVDRVLGGRRKPASGTDREALPGGEAVDLTGFQTMGRDAGLPRDTVEHLLKHYGAECASIYNLGRTDRSLYERLHPDHPAIAGEVIHAARRELAQRVDDILVRRIHLYYETRDRGRQAAGRVAALLGAELGWDRARIAEEQQRYEAWVG